MSGVPSFYRRAFEYAAVAAQSSKSVGRLFWSLPHDPRRILFHTLGLNSGVPQSLVSMILAKKALFVHVPKAAGVSVQRSLFGDVAFRHTSFRQFELAFTASQMASLFKFAFVRNPWDRLVSAWLFLRDGGLNEQDRTWSSENLSRYPDFESFVLDWVSRADLDRSYVHFRPQLHFLESGRKRLELNFVGRFENLAADFEHVALRLGCNAMLQSLNRTRSRKSPSYRDYYTERSAEVVAKAYAADIRTFGYEFCG